jgi:hypothetical protein
MRSLWSFLSDPTLHLLAFALFLIYLTFVSDPRRKEPYGESPLPICKVCRAHFLPNKPCDCRFPKKFATATP